MSIWVLHIYNQMMIIPDETQFCYCQFTVFTLMGRRAHKTSWKFLLSVTRKKMIEFRRYWIVVLIFCVDWKFQVGRLHRTLFNYVVIKRKFINSDGHQFHQYQQIKQTSLISTEFTEHKKDHDIWCWKSMSSLFGRDRMVVGFTTTCAISAYHHWSCEFEPRSWRGVQHYVIKFVCDLRQFGSFLQVHFFLYSGFLHQ